MSTTSEHIEPNHREAITAELAFHGETWADVVAHTLTDEQLEARPTSGYRAPFTLWTAKRVYFPTCYDSQEAVVSVPRNPCNEATVHVGGG